MPSLFVTCHRCRFEFPTGIAITGPIGTLSVFGLRHRCPRCGSEGAYYTQEYHFPDGFRTPPGPGAPTWYIPSEFTPSRTARPEGGHSNGTARMPFGWLVGRGVALEW
ncbi:MAG: hypothetical protein WCB18_02455 [Thermoplasmata archaeon]